MAVVEPPDMVAAHHKRVEVDAVMSGCCLMMKWVDIIRAAFERLDAEALSLEGAEEAEGDGSFSGIAVCCGHEKLSDHGGKLGITAKQLCLQCRPCIIR